MANRTVNGEVYEIVPDLELHDSTHIEACWACDLAKQCQPLSMFCQQYMYSVHFKLAANECK